MTSSLLPRSLAVLAAATAVALPVAGCGDSSGSSSSSGNGGADPAALLPATAPVYVEAQVRPDGDLAANSTSVLAKILRTNDPGGKIVGWLDSSMKDNSASYAKDIEPWLGQKAGLAVTSIGATGDDVDVVAAIASKDDDAAQKFVDKRPGATDREYRGVKYKYKSDGDMAAAVIDHAIVIGTDKGFKSAIDAEKGGAKLSDAAAFKKARDVVGDNGLGFAYADPAKFFDLVAGAASHKLSSGNAQSLQMVKGLLAGSGLQSVALKLDVAKNALKFDAAAVGVKAPKASGDGPGAAADVPAGSWLSLGIGDVGGTFENALKSFGSSGALGGMDPATLMQGLKSQLGVDVQKDLLSWMGDAGLFVRGTDMSSLGGALVVKSKDPAASKAAIPKLKKVLEGLNVKVGALTGAPSGVDGFSVDAGSGLPSAIEVGTKDDKFIVAIGKGVLADAFAPAGGTLGDSEPYKTAAGLLDGAKPSLFLDTPQVVKLLNTFAGSDEDWAKAKPTLDAFGPAAAGLSSDGDATRLKAAVAVP
jgi:hypothetical protein